MATYDVHQHLWPPGLIDALRRRKAPPRIKGSQLELATGTYTLDVNAHELDARLESLDDDGIEIAVVSLQPTLAEPLPPELVDAYHEGIVELTAESGGRIVPLAAGAALPGFAGACVAAGALVDVDAIAALLDELDRKGQMLFVHPGPGGSDDGKPAWWSAGVDYVAQMQLAHGAWLADGAMRWPNLPVVFAIMAGGACIQLERLAGRGLDVRLALEANVYFDTASYGRRALELCLATYGVRHVLYGSDVPVTSSEPTLSEVRHFGEAVATALCEDNPTRLFG
jgi:6-methylsalicylate decarboxylase